MHTDLLALCGRFSGLNSSPYLNSHPCTPPSLSTATPAYTVNNSYNQKKSRMLESLRGGKKLLTLLERNECRFLASLYKICLQIIFPAINQLVVLCGTAAAKLTHSLLVLKPRHCIA